MVLMFYFKDLKPLTYPAFRKYETVLYIKICRYRYINTRFRSRILALDTNYAKQCEILVSDAIEKGNFD
jgi:hypothetical protein